MNSDQKAVIREQKLKITIDQLKNYLGTGLKILRPDGKTQLELIGIEGSNILIFDEKNKKSYGDISKNKPICYRLSDLDKFIDELGGVPARELAKLITQSGWNHENIVGISEENNTIIVRWPIVKHPMADLWIQRFFEIDIDEDFGFNIYSKRWLESLECDPSEDESLTGNVWLMYQKLFEWNFWPFGDEYFDQDLIKDKLLCAAAPPRETLRKEDPNA